MTYVDYKCKLKIVKIYKRKRRGEKSIMMTIEKSKISESEWEIMRVVWTLKEVTSKEINEVLKDKMNWKLATTKTLIGRLVKKGILITKSDGKRYLYSAAVSEQESLKAMTNDLFNHICSKKTGETIAELLSNATLSHEDIALLEKLLEMKKKEAVSEVSCNCIPGQCQCHHMNE